MHYIILLVIFTIYTSCKKADTPPQLIGLRVTASGLNTAVIQNTMITDGGSAPIAAGTVWSSSESTPTLENCVGHATNHPGIHGDYTDSLRGLSYNTKYYIRAYATNTVGTGYSPVDSFLTIQTDNPPGKAAFGGAVLMMDSTGEHGLVVALPKNVATLAWANDHVKLDGTSADFGAGQANTQHILSSLAAPGGTAAFYCQNLTAEGFHDWFLPSYEEMQYFRNNLSFVQWLSYPWNLYWSSSEYSASTTYFVVIGGAADFRD